MKKTFILFMFLVGALYDLDARDSTRPENRTLFSEIKLNKILKNMKNNLKPLINIPTKPPANTQNNSKTPEKILQSIYNVGEAKSEFLKFLNVDINIGNSKRVSGRQFLEVLKKFVQKGKTVTSTKFPPFVIVTQSRMLHIRRTGIDKAFLWLDKKTLALVFVYQNKLYGIKYGSELNPIVKNDGNVLADLPSVPTTPVYVKNNETYQKKSSDITISEKVKKNFQEHKEFRKLLDLIVQVTVNSKTINCTIGEVIACIISCFRVGDIDKIKKLTLGNGYSMQLYDGNPEYYVTTLNREGLIYGGVDVYMHKKSKKIAVVYNMQYTVPPLMYNNRFIVPNNYYTTESFKPANHDTYPLQAFAINEIESAKKASMAELERRINNL